MELQKSWKMMTSFCLANFQHQPPPPPSGYRSSFHKSHSTHTHAIVGSMDQISIKTPNPKGRIYWCLLEFIDWMSCWYFRPLLWTSAALPSLVHLPPSLPPSLCEQQGIGGLRQINTCRQVPLLVTFFKQTFRVWYLFRYLFYGWLRPSSVDGIVNTVYKTLASPRAPTRVLEKVGVPSLAWQARMVGGAHIAYFEPASCVYRWCIHPSVPVSVRTRQGLQRKPYQVKTVQEEKEQFFPHILT